MSETRGLAVTDCLLVFFCAAACRAALTDAADVFELIDDVEDCDADDFELIDDAEDDTFELIVDLEECEDDDVLPKLPLSLEELILTLEDDGGPSLELPVSNLAFRSDTLAGLIGVRLYVLGAELSLLLEAMMTSISKY